MQIKENPFDRDLKNIPIIRFVVHSNSLSNEILTGDSFANRLLKLNGFNQINILPLPVSNKDVHQILVNNGLLSTEYYSYESGVALKMSDGSIHNVVSYVANRPKVKLWEEVIDGSTVTLADIFASNVGDFLVVGMNDPALKIKVAKNNIVTAEKALDIVRILLTNLGLFQITPRGPTVNEWFYYLYRHKHLYKDYQYAWTIAVHTHGKELSEKVYDYLKSLGTRLMFICRSYDKVAFFSLKTPNWDTQLNQLYHLSFLIMLITGIFDDLAHIIEVFYSLNIRDLLKIGLRFNPKDKKSEFYPKLLKKDVELHNLLTNIDTQIDINAFYPIRDSLQHREFLSGIQYSIGFDNSKNVFELSSEAAERLSKASDAQNCIVRLDKPYLNPIFFIDWAQKVTIRLTNSVLSTINWASIYETLPDDIKKKIRKSNNQFAQGVGGALFGEEPYYF